MNHPESILQISCVRWFRYQHPEKILFSIPNGGKRNAREAARLKIEGVLAGVWDLLLMEPNKEFSGLWLECKSGKNGLTENQITFRLKAISRGYDCKIFRSFDEFEKIVTDYLK